MKARLTRPLVALVAAITLAAAPRAAAFTAATQESVSSNWSGYVSKGTRFSKVSASWVQPSITQSPRDAYSVFWVGLGGSGSSNALEQIGTEASQVDGKLSYFAWYELVPSGPVKLPLAIRPGDRIYTEVSVSGSAVTVAIADQRTKQWAKKTLHANNPDTGSAEWIAEAPSSCDGAGNCRPLPLANFGTVTFNDATATADGHAGAIADPDWTTQAVRLNQTATDWREFVSLEWTPGGAEPSDVSPDGSSFSVAWNGRRVNVGPPGSPPPY